MTSLSRRVVWGLLFVVAACGQPHPTDACDGVDPLLSASSFVMIIEPTAGLRAESPLRVRGCSRTFESNVVWRLTGRDGSVLASGHATGGGNAGAAAFEFDAEFPVTEPTVAQLEVFEPDESDGEGFPSPRTTIPLVLVPHPG